MSKLFFLLCSIVGVAIIFFVLIVPDYRSLQRVTTEVRELEKNIEIIKNLEVSRESLEKKQRSIAQKDMQKLEKILPYSPDNIRLIIQLDEIAKRNGLTMLKDVSYDAEASEVVPGQVEENPKEYRTYRVSFSTSGQYNQFLIFLEEIEKNLRLVDIMSVELKNSQKEGGISSSLQEFKIELQAYWLSETYE
jgi:Tfp pilus assembly protein PilO